MMFKWIKKGVLYSPKSSDYSHGSHPCIIHVEKDSFVVAFSARNEKQQAHIFLAHARVKNGDITLTSKPKLALEPGALGYFDADGVISGCLVKNANKYYLYFIGWLNLPDKLWTCNTGRAILDIDNLTLQKEFKGPILGCDKNHPLFAAATAFYITKDNVWHTWYNSGIKWEKTPEGLKHYYGLHYATSKDGINWDCKPGFCIPFKDKYEYAFGRPSVVKWNDVFHMWFAHRETKDISTYRIGYASSIDGEHWDRHDEISGIDVSSQGWDSQMVCYPCVFAHDGYKYMLYNGNNYGKTGFGFAVLEDN